MKKSIFLIAISLFILQFNLSARELNSTFSIGKGELSLSDNSNLNTTIYNYQDNGADVFLPSELRLLTGKNNVDNKSTKYNILNLNFHQQLDLNVGENYLGGGLKSFNKIEEKAKTSAYALDLIFKTIQPLSKNFDFNLSLTYRPIGKYNVTAQELEYEGSFSGYNMNVNLLGQLSDTFSIKGGYLIENYNFGEDIDKKIASYSESFNGFYLGGEINF